VWRIEDFLAKLRRWVGRTLVSSPFSIGNGLDNVLLIINPNLEELVHCRNRRKNRIYRKRNRGLSLHACLKLKIPNSPTGFELEYFVTLGVARLGPFKHNFSESTVSECDGFGDWLKHLDADHGLTLAVEIILPSGASATGEAGSGELRPHHR